MDATNADRPWVTAATSTRDEFVPGRGYITPPTLVLSGANDPVVPPVNARILGARIPNATVHVVPGTGHLLLMERGPQCAALIAAFLHPDL